MGVIYQATHSVIGRTAAIKVLSTRYSSDKNMIKRLHREARAVNQIGHPNIIDIFDFGQTPDRREYFVMEYLPGHSLAQLLEKHGRLPWSLVAPIVTQILDALAAAHDQGIVHRDMKPENILVVQSSGEVTAKILDFGIAKSVGLGPEGERLTKAGVVLGTPEYIAPEQIRGKQVDGRADLYGVGVMLFEMVMGRRPFEAEQVISLLMAHLKQPVPQMDDIPLPLGVPEFVPAVVNRALAKDPVQRFPDARTFARALELDTAGVEPVDGTRPLPQMMWEKGDAPQGFTPAQATEQGLGPAIVPQGPTTAAIGSKVGPQTLQGAGPVLPLPQTSAQVTMPGPVLPTSAFPEERRRSPMIWVIPVVVVLLGCTAVMLYFALRSEPGPATQPVVKHLSRHDAAPPKQELNLQVLFERVRRTLRAGTTNVTPEVRQASIRGIGRLRESDAFALLSAALREDPEVSVRAAAAKAIASLGDPAGVEALREARKSSGLVMKVFIDKALLELGNAEGRIGLKDALRSKNKDARLHAALALGEARSDDALPVLVEVSGQMAILNPNMFPLVLGTLAQLGHKDAFETLVKTLSQKSTSKETEVQKLGASEALAKLGGDEATDTLKTIMREGSSTSKLVAARILARHLGDYSGLEQLAAGLKAKDAASRALAARGMGEVMDEAAIAPLAQALDDKEWRVKAEAAEALGRILSQMPSALVRRSQDWLKVAMDHGDWSVRFAAAEITSDMDPELAMNLLSWAFKDSDPRVRRAAVAGLGKLRSKKALPLLRRALVDKDDGVRAEAVRALARVGGKEETEALNAAVRDKTPSVGISAAGALLAMGVETYLKDLKQATRSKNATIRRDAFLALGRWKRKEKLLPLLKTALKDRSPLVRHAAAVRLAELEDASGAGVLRASLKQAGPDQSRTLAALSHIGVKPTREVTAMARSSSPESRRQAMAAAHLLPPDRGLSVLGAGARDADRGVRLAAATGLSRVAEQSPKTLVPLSRLAADPDPLVRARAAIGLARARNAHAAIAKLDRVKVAPVKQPTFPELPKAPPKPPRDDKKPMWVEPDVNSAQQLYNRYMASAEVASSRGRYDLALKLYEKARAQQDTAAVHCDMGQIMLRRFLRGIEKTTALLTRAQKKFEECLRRANTKRLRRKAQAGRRDVGRYLNLKR